MNIIYSITTYISGYNCESTVVLEDSMKSWMLVMHSKEKVWVYEKYEDNFV